MSYNISGIQQVGVGCLNIQEQWKWIIDMFKADIRVLEDDTVAERMLRYTGGQKQKRHAAIAINLQGGGGFEIWQYSDRKPAPCSFEVEAGDLGVFAARIKSRNPKAFREELLKKYDKIGPLSSLPDGTECFMIMDPWKNCYQVVKDDYIYIEEKNLTGAVVGAMVGSTDIDRVLPLWQNVLGYDKVVYDKTGTFEDLSYMKGSEGRFRRVLLTHSKSRKGPFADLYGKSAIELVQALDRVPRRIFEGRYWGDPGFIQICFDVSGMRDFEKACESAGYPFTVDGCPNDERFDMGEASGHFTYIEDPDGLLIEFVETQKVTVLKHPHVYFDMTKRDPLKPFPKFMFRLMGLFRVKF